MINLLKKIMVFILFIVFVFGNAAEAATVRLPSAVRKIETEAFYGDTGLDVVYIPSEVQAIGARAFAYSSARVVVFYGDVTSFGKDIFKGCNLEAIECGSWNTNTRNWLMTNGYEDILTEWYVKATPYASEEKIKVEWTTGPNATSYTLFYSTGSKGNPLATVNSVNVGNVGEYVLTGLESYTTYHIWVVAYRDSHEIDESDDIEAVTKGNGPNPQFDDPIIPGDGPVIRDVYSKDSGKTLIIEFDEYEGAAWYDVIFRNTENDEYETMSVNAAESTQNGLVSTNAWIETMLQDNTTYKISVKAYDSNLQLLSFESDDPAYYTTDFSAPIIYPASITLNRDEKEMRVGDSYDLTATLEPSGLSAEASGIIWGSFDESVASVDDGEVYANSMGTAVIYARTLNGLYAYCQITVLPDPYITGGFQDSGARKIVKYGYQDQLTYHVEVEYAKLKNIKLVQRDGNTTDTVFTNKHSGQTAADGYFTISAEPGGEFRSLGSVYTFDLVVTLMDGTTYTIDTATVEIGFGIPQQVGNVKANYSSGDIHVSWDNNGDAKRFRVIYYTPDGQTVSFVDVDDENATQATIPDYMISEYTTYLIYIVAYPTDSVEFYSRSDTVRVTTVNNATPAVTARFVGNQKVYAPGETIKIEITYNNITRVHYHNGDVNFNPNALSTNTNSGDIGVFSSDRSGTAIVELEAQSVSGWYIVEINAKNKDGVQASHFYDYTTQGGVDCLGLTYYVDADGLDAPAWRTARSMSAVTDLIWTYVQRAIGYRVWISTTPDINDAEARDVGDINQYTLTGLITGRNYYVWVQAIDSNGGGGISSRKDINLSETSPSVSAVITKNNIAPGDSIPIRITYSNVIKVHYQNGTGDHGDIWADDNLMEGAEYNASGTETVYLTAQPIPGTYYVTIWAKDYKGHKATSDEGLKVKYTVTGEPPSPYVLLNICPESTDTVMQGVNENNVIWLMASYTNATKLVYTLHNSNNTDYPTYKFTTSGYYDSNPSMSSFTFPDLTFASYSQNEGMSFIPADSLEPGTYTLRVTATNDFGGEPATDTVYITVLDNDELLSVDVGRNKSYMNTVIRNKVAQYKSDLNEGQVLIFMFEGCGDSSLNKRANAVCVVVKNVNGVPQIAFRDAESSTIPDNPLNAELNWNGGSNKKPTNYATATNWGPIPTVIDGDYPFSSTTHDNYAALKVSSPYVVRFDKDNNQYNKWDKIFNGHWLEGVTNCNGDGRKINGQGVSGGIHVHHRYYYTSDNSITSTSRNSTGCITISQYTSSLDKYTEFLVAVNRIPDEEGITYTSTATPSYFKGGTIIIDRAKAKDYLVSIYGSEKTYNIIRGIERNDITE